MSAGVEEDRNEARSDRQIHILALLVAALVASATLFHVWKFTPTLALPDVLPDSSPFKNMDARAASADALRDKIGFLTTLAFSLIAAVAFMTKDGFGRYSLQRCINIILTALFGCLVTNSFLSAFDAYNMISIQLLDGLLFATLVDPLIAKQAYFLILATIVALALINTRIGGRTA